jgi:hypothetical protein
MWREVQERHTEELQSPQVARLKRSQQKEFANLKDSAKADWIHSNVPGIILTPIQQMYTRSRMKDQWSQSDMVRQKFQNSVTIPTTRFA